jgi:ornithine carbamoyltransferase
MTPKERRDFLSIDDLSADELTGIVDLADKIKKSPGRYKDKLEGRQIALIFEKPSTRTRVSFEVAVTSLGGHAVVLRGEELQLGRGETIEDTGEVLSRYVDAIGVRTFGQERLHRLAGAATVPVINLLSDYSHPCQILADLQTIRAKKGGFEKLSLGYLGDGNNVAHSLLFGGAKLGMDVRVASPPGYQPDGTVVDRASKIAAESGGKVTVTDVVAEAATAADILYTDVWASMGREEESAHREEIFEHYRLDAEAVALASDDVIVMHCLPAHRGQEISAEVMDGDRSVVWEQAENRLHSQKALLVWLLT